MKKPTKILIVIGSVFLLIIIIAGASGSSNTSTAQPATNQAQPKVKSESVFIPEPIPETSAPMIPPPALAPKQNCHPSYEGACLNPNASDYDCAGGSGNGPYYTGTVRVVGPDVFGLDRDHDGWGCE